MKKIFVMMMAVAALGAVLGGCAGEENTDNTPAEPTMPEGGGPGNTSM
ncbi:MAG: hypothetical protein ABIV13_02550 [Fimbriimonadales bacterium]